MQVRSVPSVRVIRPTTASAAPAPVAVKAARTAQAEGAVAKTSAIVGAGLGIGAGALGGYALGVILPMAGIIAPLAVPIIGTAIVGGLLGAGLFGWLGKLGEWVASKF